MTRAAVYPSLEGKSVFITGGATGIGASLVQHFTTQGARVGFIDIDEHHGQELVANLDLSSGRKPWFRRVDVRDVSSLQDAIRAFNDQNAAVDVLVNNVANDARHQPLEVTEAAWRECMAVNLDSAFFAAQTAIPMMQRTGGGSIINFSSINALLGPTEMPGYVSAKAALLGLTKALARHYGADGIRVNAILPGWVITPKQLSLWLTPEIEQEWMNQTALKDRILPDDVAKLALFLASDDSRMITNQQFIIDGGRV
jgi:NAD(P)-dependent dehydrogenase (short-subunit alcohol dehydrogenase family)